MKYFYSFLLFLLGALPLSVCMVGWVGLCHLLESTAPDVVMLGALLLFLPPTGLTRFSKSPWFIWVIGSWLWSAFLFFEFPVFFPAKRKAALSKGSLVVGLPEAQTESMLSFVKDDPKLSVKKDSETVPTPSPSEDYEDLVVLPFEWQGSAMKVPFMITDSAGEPREIFLLFDTGASITSIDNLTLQSLGIGPTRTSPSVEFHTANGTTREKLLIVDNSWLGGYEVGPISVARCNSCAGPGISGLLGLNVTQHFISTVDTQKQELTLKPRRNDVNQKSSIRHWLDISGEIMGDEATILVRNNSPRMVRAVSISIPCLVGRVFPIGDIEPGFNKKQTFSLPRSRRCKNYILDLHHAQW